MKKKWLVAVFVSKRENMLKIWNGKVSYDATDITVPENTVFYFFSVCEKVNLEVSQLKLSETETIAWMGTIKELVHEGKLYCFGQMKDNSLIVTNDDFEIILDNFNDCINKNNFEIEYV